ncbi:MAG: lysylphosphatidylglycerol synthase domain-containing protein [Gammaproteobacteria bacterium]|nr:lysylphosphatidylglycerol synthase domain-containing protein [Gammaproteobacteria bacterium]
MHFNLRILQLIFLVVLAIVCVEIYRNTDIDPFGLRFPNRIELLLLLISSIGLGIFSATLWNEVAYIVTGKRNSFKLAIVNTGLLLIGKYIPGKIWGVAARTVVNSKMDLATGETISISIVEFASSLLFSLFIGFSFFLGLKNEFSSILLLVFFIIGSTLFIFMLNINKWLVKGVSTFSSRIKALNVPEISVYQAFIILILLIVYWGVFGIGLTGIQSIVDVDNNLKTFLFILSAYIFSVTAGFLVIVAPGGIGVREATFTGLCAGVIEIDKLIEMAVYIRIWLTLFEIVIGALSIAIMGKLKN